MKAKKLWRGARMAALSAAVAAAICPALAEKPNTKVDFSGYFSLQEGEIVKGEYGGQYDMLDHQWQQRLLGGFALTATVNERLKIIFGHECGLFQSVYDLTQATNYTADLESFHAFFKFYLDQMQGIYSFGNLDDPYLRIGLGYFKYSYNRDVKSLGEYLFRATAYPGYIINDFASVYKRLPGIYAEYKPLPGLTIDAMLTSEVQAPVGDFTPSLLASYAGGGTKQHPVFEFGAGASFTRLLSVNPSLTTPKIDENKRILRYRYDTMSVNGIDTTIDSVGIDSVYYSFAAIKVMARFSFDPKPLFGNPGIFGGEDLKLYAEACILGTRDYPVYYDNILKRIPVMVGFNFPTFKLLDVLSAEVEWYDNKYSNNYQIPYRLQLRAPLPVESAKEPAPYPWYWAIYAARTIVPGLQVMGEVGRNHYFTAANLSFYQDRREECPNHGDWQFVLRAQYSF
jgi:hypothetical protein